MPIIGLIIWGQNILIMKGVLAIAGCIGPNACRPMRLRGVYVQSDCRAPDALGAMADY
jgi:hypothetical protein